MGYIPSQPVPEPAGDVVAQIAAMLDPEHPKRAVFVVPQDAARLSNPPAGVFVVERPEGTLVTRRSELAGMFRQASSDAIEFDRHMALILGLPEAKPDIDERCRGNAKLARMVQARDAGGHVVQECVVSHLYFLPACAAMQEHVPARGRLVIMSPAAAISRRVAMRWVEQ
jgi:hypothetical protein